MKRFRHRASVSPAAHVSGRCTVVRGSQARSSRFQGAAGDLALHLDVPWLAAGICPGESPRTGSAGTPHSSTISRADPMMTVGMPAASRCRATKTHGLVADGSKRDEKGRVDAVLTHPRFGLGGHRARGSGRKVRGVDQAGEHPHPRRSACGGNDMRPDATVDRAVAKPTREGVGRGRRRGLEARGITGHDLVPERRSLAVGDGGLPRRWALLR